MTEDCQAMQWQQFLIEIFIKLMESGSFFPESESGFKKIMDPNPVSPEWIQIGSDRIRNSGTH